MAGGVNMPMSDQLEGSWLLHCILAGPDPDKQLCSAINGKSAGSMDNRSISWCAAASAMLLCACETNQHTCWNSGLKVLESSVSSLASIFSSDIGRTSGKQSLSGKRALIEALICVSRTVGLRHHDMQNIAYAAKLLVQVASDAQADTMNSSLRMSG